MTLPDAYNNPFDSPKFEKFLRQLPPKTQTLTNPHVTTGVPRRWVFGYPPDSISRPLISPYSAFWFLRLCYYVFRGKTSCWANCGDWQGTTLFCRYLFTDLRISVVCTKVVK